MAMVGFRTHASRYREGLGTLAMWWLSTFFTWKLVTNSQFTYTVHYLSSPSPLLSCRSGSRNKTKSLTSRLNSPTSLTSHTQTVPTENTISYPLLSPPAPSSPFRLLWVLPEALNWDALLHLLLHGGERGRMVAPLSTEWSAVMESASNLS